MTSLSVASCQQCLAIDWARFVTVCVVVNNSTIKQPNMIVARQPTAKLAHRAYNHDLYEAIILDLFYKGKVCGMCIVTKFVDNLYSIYKSYKKASLLPASLYHLDDLIHNLRLS